MKQLVTRGIVLARTNYQEADRIVTLLTPDHGKLRVLARGVRKSKSKLAGGIELFSVSEIGFIRGKRELGTLTSSRLLKHYDTIVQDINRTMLGYELIKLLHRVTEDEPEAEYFQLLHELLEALDSPAIAIDLVRLWFYAQLLRQAGHTPNLRTTAAGKALEADQTYLFGYDDMSFGEHPSGTFLADHIKFLRLVFSGNPPSTLQQVSGLESLLPQILQLVQTILPAHIRT